MHRIIVYQNVVYNYISLHLFLLLYQSGMHFHWTSVRSTQFDSIRTFQGKISVNNTCNNNVSSDSAPLYCTYGNRYIYIIHTRLRHSCAPNYNLCRCNIINTSFCSCGKTEDIYHYFLHALSMQILEIPCLMKYFNRKFK